MNFTRLVEFKFCELCLQCRCSQLVKWETCPGNISSINKSSSCFLLWDFKQQTVITQFYFLLWNGFTSFHYIVVLNPNLMGVLPEMMLIFWFKVALGCMAIRTQTELMIRRVQFIRRTKDAATQAACAGNTRGYHSEYGNSWFNNRENDDAYYIFRSYNNC